MVQKLLQSLNGKQAMAFGFVGGVALLSIIGFVVLLSKTISGASASPPAAIAGVRAADNAPAPHRAPANPAGLSPVTDADHVRGNPAGRVTLIEFSDFECPFCRRHAPTLKQVLTQYKDQVRLVYRHFPLNSIHPHAQKAAEASECAAEQGTFWEYHDLLFDNQPALSISDLKRYASQLGLEQKKFDSCLDGGIYAAKVEAHTQEGLNAGVSGTPATFVNGQLVSGAVPISVLTQIIEAQLAN